MTERIIETSETEFGRQGVELIVEPRFKETWEKFLEHCGPYAIALDGRVVGATKRDVNLPAANFNHHEGSDRTSTTATCSQVYNEIKLGLFNTFKKDGNPFVRLFVEDCDEDVCTAVALFEMYCENPQTLENPKLIEFVQIENQLDMSGGMYPMDHSTETMGQIRWVFEPYRVVRRNGSLFSMDSQGMQNVIAEVVSRIKKYATGNAESVALDGRYHILGGGEGWWMVEEIGKDSRAQLANDKKNAFLSVSKIVSNQGEVKWKYSLIRNSPWQKFPLPELYAFLNQEEGIDSKSNDTWGGSDLSGGSPKIAHTTIPPDRMQELINGFLKIHYKKTT